MRTRAVLTVLLCNFIALLLMGAAGFLVVRLTPWGHWAVDSSKASAAELASRYGDPVALLQRGVFFHMWVLGPGIALLLGAIAALILRRTDLRVSTLSVVSAVGILATPTSFARAFAACLYILMSWLAMKLLSSWMTASAPNTTAKPSAQK